MEFSIRLENLLEERNLKQKQLAAALDIAPSTLNGYLRQGREPNYETLVDIANFFEVSTDYLLGATNIRCPYREPESYDDKEKFLIETYRSLAPQEQTYLIKQAHIYYNQNLDIPDSQKKDSQKRDSQKKDSQKKPWITRKI